MNKELLQAVRQLSVDTASMSMSTMRGVTLADFAILLAVYGNRQRALQALGRSASDDYAVMLGMEVLSCALRDGGDTPTLRGIVRLHGPRRTLGGAGIARPAAVALPNK